MRWLSVFRVTLREQLRSPWDLLMVLILAPFFVWMYWSMVGGGSTSYKILVINQDQGSCPAGVPTQTCAEQVIAGLSGLTYESGVPLLRISLADGRLEAEQLLRDRKAAALIIFSPDFTSSIRSGRPLGSAQVTFVGDLNNPYYSPAAIFSNAILNTYLREAAGQTSPILVTEQALSGSTAQTEFEIYVPGLLIAAGTMMLFSVAIALTRQIESGTVRRLRLTRMTAWDFLGGISLLYGLISLLSVIFSFITARALGYNSSGPIWVAGLICLLTSLSVIGVGFITACFSGTAARAAIIVNFPLFLLLFFSGAVFPLGNPRITSVAGHDFGIFDLLPQTHATNALNKVLSLGVGLGDVAYELIALSVLAVLYFLVGIWLFHHKYLRLV